MPKRLDHGKIREAWRLRNEGEMSQEDIAERLEVGPRQLSNYYDPKWLGKHKIMHLMFPARPMHNIEQAAYDRCKADDHGFMEEYRYLDHAFIQEGEEVGPAGLMNSLDLRRDRTCLFCGHTVKAVNRYVSGIDD